MRITAADPGSQLVSPKTPALPVLLQLASPGGAAKKRTHLYYCATGLENPEVCEAWGEPLEMAGAWDEGERAEGNGVDSWAMPAW